MPIKWTIIVLGALLHAMASVQSDTPDKDDLITQPSSTSDSVTTPITVTTLSNITYTTVTATPFNTATPAATNSHVEPTTQSNPSDLAAPTSTADSTTKTDSPSPTESTTLLTSKVAPSSPNYSSTSKPDKQPDPGVSLSPTYSVPATQSQTSVPTDRVTTPSTADSATQPGFFSTAMPTPTVPSKQITTDKETNTGIQIEIITTATGNFMTTVSQSLQTMKAQATTSIPTVQTPGSKTSGDNTVASTPTPGQFIKNFDLSSSSEGNIIHEACKVLGSKMNGGKCSVNVTIQDKQLIAIMQIDADQLISTDMYKLQEEKKDEAMKPEVMKPDTLIAILASCGALVLILCGFAAYCTYHRRSYRKNQQHLTEELQTVENGYHDNPTLEVMEVQPEMQEKKLALNGEFNDSWIVPIDNLLKDNIPDEEDTHL